MKYKADRQEFTQSHQIPIQTQLLVDNIMSKVQLKKKQEFYYLKVSRVMKVTVF